MGKLNRFPTSKITGGERWGSGGAQHLRIPPPHCHTPFRGVAGGEVGKALPRQGGGEVGKIYAARLLRRLADELEVTP